MPNVSELSLRPPVHRPAPRALWYWGFRALAGWVFATLAQIGWLFLARDDGLPWLHRDLLILTPILAVPHVLLMPPWRLRVHRWETTPEAVYTQTGWFVEERRIAPVSRVQTVDTARGPFEQLFNLTNVTVTTASAAGPLKIAGLEAAAAQRLVAELTTRAQLGKGDAT